MTARSEPAALPGQAAAAAIGADRLEHAVELLEQTRGQLLAESLGSRSEVSGLRESEPDAAGGLRQAADEWDDLLARIRAPWWTAWCRPIRAQSGRSRRARHQPITAA